MLKLFGLALTVALAATALLGAGQALAGHVQCGDVITRDTTLDADLIDCRGGLYIGADDVTVDLNGHTIDGDVEWFGAGIESGGHDGVTIQDGTIREFVDGIRLNQRGTLGGHVVRRLVLRDNRESGIEASGSGNRIEHNRVESNRWWGMSVYGVNTVISGNSVSGNAYGVDVSLTDSVVRANSASGNRAGFWGGVMNTRVVGNVAVGNEWGGMHLGAKGSDIDGNLVQANGEGIRIGRFNPFVDISDNRIRRNVVRENAIDGISVGEAQMGVPTSPQVHHNTIEANRVSRNGRHGLYLVDTGQNNLERNRVSGNGGTGVTMIYPRHNRIAENVLSGNALDGISIYGRDATKDNLLSGNTAAGNGGAGISVGGLDNRIEHNKATANRGDGIIVFNTQVNVVDGNVANRNGDDGIDLNDEAASVVARNTANRNRDFGISSFEGVVDGGGNRARRNGAPVQCLVVLCDAG
jgi:large repetitive protein